MKMELDKKEYENVVIQARKEGASDASTMIFCKRNPKWRKGDLHLTTKGLSPLCLVCMNNAENTPKLAITKIANDLSVIFNKRFPPTDKNNYKSNDLFDKVVKYLEEELKPKEELKKL